MVTAIKHPVPDRVKPSFVIFDIRALWRSVLDCTAGRFSLLCITMRHPRSQPSWKCQYTTTIEHMQQFT